MDTELAQRIQDATLMAIPFLAAVVFHEVGHAWMAKYWGDNTAEEQGRLTFNPLPHIDPLGTIVLPIIGMISGFALFGWAKPVPINPNRFRKYRPGLFWVSIAGVSTNMILAFISALMFAAMLKYLPGDFQLAEPLIKMAQFAVQINILLAIFNLLPLPPFDGAKIIDSFLPYEASRKFNSIEPYSFYIFLALMMTGALSVIHPPVIFLTRLFLGSAGAILGVT
jgi:Zn-dependent protease